MRKKTFWELLKEGKAEEASKEWNKAIKKRRKRRRW